MPPFGETATSSGPTAQADSPTSLRQGAPAERPPAPKAPRALPDLLLLVGCAAIAWLSLLRPWAVNPDAWHWLRWGDEMRRLTLDTTGTWTSWKPMPSLLAIPISAFHESAPAIWTVIARTGAVVTVVIGFRLSATLVTLSSRRDGWLRRVNCVVAGSIAALLLIYLQSGDALSGYSEPITLALGLAALERAIAGRHIGAFALGWACCLGRPEPMGVMILYGFWLWSREPKLRAWIVAMPFAILAAWFVPDWIGSGDFGRSSKLLRDVELRPGRNGRHGSGIHGVLEGTFVTLPREWWLAVVVGMAGSVVQARRGNRSPLIVLLVALGVGLAIVALAAAGGPARARYAVIVTAPLTVIAGFGIGWASQAIGEWAARLGTGSLAAIGLVPAALGVTMVALLATGTTLPDLNHDRRTVASRAGNQAQLTAVIRKAGGPQAILKCRPIARKSRSDGIVAWKLGIKMEDFSVRGGPADPRVLVAFPTGTTFRDIPLKFHSPNERSSDAIAPGARMIARAGRWEIWQNCDSGPVGGIAR